MIEWGTGNNTQTSLNQYWVWNSDATAHLIADTPILILPAVNYRRCVNLHFQKLDDTDPIFQIKLWIAVLPPNSGMINFPDLVSNTGFNIINWELSGPLTIASNSTEANRVLIKCRTAVLR